MEIFLYKYCHNLITILMSVFSFFINAQANELNYRYEGITYMSGSIISTPCSIVMSNQYQVIDFSSLTIHMLSSDIFLEEKEKPLTIELINCGNLFSTIDSKTWNIQFNGYVSSNLDSFLLTGPSRGLSISILDKDKSLIYPNKIYSLKNSVLRTSNKQDRLYLQFFLQLGLTGEYIQAGDYQGIISFFIDYQ